VSSAMSNDAGRPRPNVAQFNHLLLRKGAAASMRTGCATTWGAREPLSARMIRFILPAVVVAGPVLADPTTLYVHASMTLPIFLPYVLFTHALNRVWRRHLLSKNGLDPTWPTKQTRPRRPHPPRLYRTLRPPVLTTSP